MKYRNHPESIPEDDSEDAGTRWLKISEAAVLLGMTERAARDWVKRHQIRQRGKRPVRVAETEIRKTLEALGQDPRKSPEATTGRFGTTTDPIDVSFEINEATQRALVPLDRMIEQTQGLAEQLITLAQRNEAFAREVGMLQERTTTQEQTISRLMAEREALEAQVQALTTPQPTSPEPDYPGKTTDEAQIENLRPLGRWQRLLRWLYPPA